MQKYMVEFAVDVAEALRRGKPSPAKVQLNLLADDGQLVIGSEEAELLGKHLNVWDAAGVPCASAVAFKLPQPDLDGLDEAFRKLREREERERAEATAVVEKALAAGPHTSVRSWSELGQPYVDLPVLTLPYVSETIVQLVAPELAARWEKEKRRVEAFNESAMAAARAQWEAAKAAHDAQVAEKTAQIAAEREQLIRDFIPQVMQQRYADGFASKSEIDRALCEAIRANVAFVPSGGYRPHTHSVAATTLTDEAYLALVELKKKLPKGVSVEVRGGSVYESCPDCYDRTCGACDRDNEVRTAAWYFARLTWQVADLEVRANVHLADIDLASNVD